MTSSRIVRGTKGRIFIYVIAVILITGIIACYNNTLTQLDDVKKSNDVCHQESENLSTQLQMISDYKQRLEKTLKTDKAEHQQTKTNLEKQLSDEKAKSEKTALEAKHQLSSLQQHYNLLKTQHDDFKQKCSDSQAEQLTEINNLQAKLKEVQEELKKVEGERENLKTEYLEIKTAKETLEERIRGTQGAHLQSENEINRLTHENKLLKVELEGIKRKIDMDTLQIPQIQEQPKDLEASSKPTQLNLTNNSPPKDNANIQNDNSENVLAMPNGDSFKKVSPSGASLKASSKASLDGARPIEIPTEGPQSSKKDSKLPEGVVPVPNNEMNVIKKPETEQKNAYDDINDALPNRYRNNIVQNEKVNEEKAERLERDMKLNVKLEEGDKENGANEIFDAPANEKNKFDAHHIDDLGDLGENQLNEGQDPEYDKVHEDPDEDDDPDYGNIPRHPKEPAERN